MRTAELVNKT